jgi:hypothetical protein
MMSKPMAESLSERILNDEEEILFGVTRCSN